MHEQVRAFPHLCQAAWRGGNCCELHGLDRIDDDNIRLGGRDRIADSLRIGFCKDKKPVGGDIQALCTEFELPLALLAGDVQDPRYRQAITAAASGCMAARDAEKFLLENVN
jgi:hypothetical protein